MTAFDHRDPGNPAGAWQRFVAGLPTLEPPGAGDRILVLAAHPDDETLGAGGLVAAAARRGADVRVLVATDGEASHPHSPTRTPDQLAAARRDEVQAAVHTLAPDAEIVLLGLPDGRLREYPQELGDAISRLADGCTHLLTPWQHDRHPDHEACAVVARRIAAATETPQWQYPIWAWHWDDPRKPELGRVRVHRVHLDDADRAAKQRALDQHASQHRPLSDAPGDEAILPPHVVAHFSGPDEVFVVPAPKAATPVSYFEQLYGDSDDPWELESRFYEQRKRATLMAALSRARFSSAFEPGCANGALTHDLARRCDTVVAWDAVGSVAARTATRFAASTAVTVRRGSIPDDWPDGTFDLIVLSEIGYYCADLDALATRIEQTLRPDGVLVACHWRHPADAHAQTAGDVHAVVGRSLHRVVAHVEDDFLLHVWSRDGRSVATEAGIAP